MNKKTFYIQGMHCVSCEKLLHDEFGIINGVEKVNVDRKKEMADIFYEDDNIPDFSEIEKMAEKFGYGISQKKSKYKKNINWTQWALSVAIVIALVVIFKAVEKSNNISIDIDSLSNRLFLSLFIGLLASISSCLAVVGSVVIAFSEKYISQGQSAFGRILKPNLLFHFGRLVTFFFLGGILGLIGGQINISGNFISFYTILIAVIMAWLGLNILGFVPSIADTGIKFPGFFSKHWVKFKSSQNAFSPVILGALSFFLPCGFTQSMQIFALASGSFMIGGISLFLFALGTMPMLLLLGVTASFTKDKSMAVSMKVAGMLIIIFSVYTFLSGLALLGVKSNVIGSASNSIAIKKDNNPKAIDDSSQSKDALTVEMHITNSGYSPSILRVKRGQPVQWVIYGDQVTSCTNKIIVPSLNIAKDIAKGKNIISFTPDKAGEIAFSCGMGMVRGKFIVE